MRPVRLYRHPDPTMQQDFPPLFAIADTDDATPRYVWTFTAKPVGTIYVVCPVTIQSDVDPPAIILDDRPPYSDHMPVTIANEFNQLRACSLWDYIGDTVYSFMYPIPIPIIRFHNNPYLECRHHNAVRVSQGSRRAFRFWERRWDPDIVFSELTAALSMPRTQLPTVTSPPTVTPPPTVTSPPTVTPPPSSVKPLPAYVAKLLVTDAIATNAVCPITLEPITEAASVTSCFHVFNADAIASWVATGNDTCPTCKQPAVVTCLATV